MSKLCDNCEGIHFFVRSFGNAFFIWGEILMPDYKNMYKTLFNAITETIEILKEAQIKTEEMYILSSENDDNKIVELKLVEKDNKS